MTDPPKMLQITTPQDARLSQLCQRLHDLATTLQSDTLQSDAAWPQQQLDLCGQYGVYGWFLEPQWGGQGWNQADILRGYLQLSAACLTTTFILTQYTGACRRIAGAENEWVKAQLLPDLVSGRRFATLGISHLTTSRRHLAKPVLRAELTGRGFVLDGFSPWVTGAPHADVVVTGAVLEDGRQILLALPTDLPGVSTPAPARLVGLSASQTGPVQCDRVEVERRWLLGGPVENVMQQGGGGQTGGLQTSTLALGLADAALNYLEQEQRRRAELAQATAALRCQWRALQQMLFRLAEGQPGESAETLRTQANSLVLRASQAALAAAKGSGYVVGHPAARWCCEALFFLVWSCPQPVTAANLCELAGLDPAD